MLLKPVTPSIKSEKKRNSELFQWKHFTSFVVLGMKILKTAPFFAAHHVINYSPLIGFTRCTGLRSLMSLTVSDSHRFKDVLENINGNSVNISRFFSTFKYTVMNEEACEIGSFISITIIPWAWVYFHNFTKRPERELGALFSIWHKTRTIGS